MLDYLDSYITVSELAEVLKIGKNKAYELLHSRKITYFQIGRLYRVDKEDLRDYIFEAKRINS